MSETKVMNRVDETKSCVCECVKWNPFNKVIQCHRCGRTIQSKPVVKKAVKEVWIREWFSKQNEYVDGDCLDGHFCLDELADFLNRRIIDESRNSG